MSESTELLLPTSNACCSSVCKAFFAPWSTQIMAPPEAILIDALALPGVRSALSIALYELGKNGTAALGHDGQSKGCPWCFSCCVESRDRRNLGLI